MINFNKEILDALPSLYTGIIYDAMQQDVGYKKPFVLDRKIYNICGDRKMYGPAYTCQGVEVKHASGIKDEIRIKMLKKMTDGCIKVISGGNESVAISGDITTLLDMRHGAVGVILDGLVRDIDIIERELNGFPVFARGCCPIDAYGKWQIEKYQVDVFIMGIGGAVKICPDDFIFADKSGIVVIPKRMAGEVLHLATRRFISENNIRDRIKLNEDVYKIYLEEERW